MLLAWFVSRECPTFKMFTNTKKKNHQNLASCSSNYGSQLAKGFLDLCPRGLLTFGSRSSRVEESTAGHWAWSKYL